MEQQRSTADPLGLAVARIWGRQGRPVGAAFLAAPGKLLTAAHVVNLAVGASPDTEQPPSDVVELDFPLLAPGRRHRASVEHWVAPGGSYPRDIAGLRLLDTGDRVLPAPLVHPQTMFDLRAIAFGFPRLADSGVWSVVRLRGRQADGWVQLDIDEASQFAIQPGFSGAPVWDPQRGTVVGMVTHAWSGGGVKSAYMVPAAALFAAWPDLRTLATPPSPFPGLRSFTEADADVFFGRDALADRIVRRIEFAPVVTVTGPSGVGKSSLLAAAVLPRLRLLTDTAIVTVAPGRASSPLRSLALSLTRSGPPRYETAAQLREVEVITDRLVNGKAADVVGAYLASAGKQRLVIVIDQFEQALAASGDQIAAFGRALKDLSANDRLCSLLVGLRTDFISEVLRLPTMSFLASETRLAMVPELERDELREIAEAPLRRLRVVEFEDGLVDRLVADVGDEPGSLPLIQFALSQLWERQHDGRLRHVDYRAIGGAARALANHAEQVWEGLDEAQRETAERLLAQLVHPVPGRDAYTRRPAAWQDLDDDLHDIAGRLASARVLGIGEFEGAQGERGMAVELAHDALLVHWERLREIATRHREFREWQDGLRQRAERWERHPDSRRSRFLWQLLRAPRWMEALNAGKRGAPGPPPRARMLSLGELREAEKWLNEHRRGFTARELRYIAASRTRQAVIWTRVGAVVAVLALLAWDTVSTAAEQAAAVVSRELAANSDSLAFRDVYGQTQLALRAWRTSPTEEAERAVLESYERLRSVDVMLPDRSTVVSAYETRFEPDSDDERPVEVKLSDGATSIGGDAIVAIRPDLTAGLWRVGEDRVDELEFEGADDPAIVQGLHRTISAGGEYAAFIGHAMFAVSEDFPPTDCSPPGSPVDVPTEPELTECLWVYETATGTNVLTAPVGEVGQYAHARALSVDPTGSMVAAIVPSEGGWVLRRWSLSDGRRLADVDVPVEATGMTGLWLAPGGQAAVVRFRASGPGLTSDADQGLAHLDLAGQAEVKILAPVATAGSVVVSGDGERISATPIEPAEFIAEGHRVWTIVDGKEVAALTVVPTLPEGALSTFEYAQLSFDASGERMYLAAMMLEPESLPDSPPSNADELDSFSESLADLSSFRLWTWDIGSGEVREETVRFRVGWFFFRPLGADLDGTLVLTGPGGVGLVFSGDDETAYERLSGGALRAKDVPVEVAVEHLCRVLAVDAESQEVRSLAPDGAHSGSIC